jgi:anti-sigma regulatory factor (Ser/Thr protein kinase)
MTARPDEVADGPPAELRRGGAGAGDGLNDPPALGPLLAVTVPALVGRVREVRQAARRFAEQHGVEQLDDVALAIAEACANVVVHAYVDREAGELRLTGSCEGGHVRFVVADDGAGLLPRPESPGLGLGLPVIAQLADQFEVSDGDGRGTRVRMAFGVAETGRVNGSAAEGPGVAHARLDH